MNSKFKIDWTNVKKQIADADSKKDYKDSRIFVPTFNPKTGISETIIRFLPSKDTEIPYAKIWSHSFNNNGKWYIDNCHTTFKGEKCLICEYNTEHWKTDYTKKMQDDYKRKQSYFGNILVVKDPMHPENNNKVFLYRYGVKIHLKILERSNPEEGSIIEQCNVWDWNEGLDFRLIIKKISAGPTLKAQSNYDSSCFVDSPSAVGTEEQMEKIYDQLYSIKDYYNRDNFKDADKCIERFLATIGNKPQTRKSEEHQPPVSEDVEEDIISDVASVFSQIQDD